MLREDIMAVQKEIQELKEKSLAMELVRDYKKQNRRQFLIIVIMLIMWFATIGYLVYVLNDIETEEITTEETIDMTAEGNNNYIGGDNSGTIENN